MLMDSQENLDTVDVGLEHMSWTSGSMDGGVLVVAYINKDDTWERDSMDMRINVFDTVAQERLWTISHKGMVFDRGGHEQDFAIDAKT